MAKTPSKVKAKVVMISFGDGPCAGSKTPVALFQGEVDLWEAGRPFNRSLNVFSEKINAVVTYQSLVPTGARTGVAHINKVR